MHRRLVAFEGDPTATRALAAAFLCELSSDRVLWVGPEDTPPGRVRRLLGTEVDAVVVDFHEEVQADLIGQLEGLVGGGGALVLRLSPGGPPRSPARFASSGAANGSVGRRFGERLLAGVPRHTTAPSRPLVVPDRRPWLATTEQDAAVEVLAAALRQRTAAVVLADRGRGKSTALGRAARTLPARSVVIGLDPESHHRVREVGPTHLNARTPRSFLQEQAQWDAVLVDEAARIPVPVLQQIANRSRTAALLFASTTRGYEGTGRGFSLRFLPWLKDRRPVTTLRLKAPIRWAAGDPVEQWLRTRLCLDTRGPAPDPTGDPRLVRLPPQRLAQQPALLAAVFSLLVRAHYRTTPGDLQRILDAPSLHVFAALDHEDRPLAVNLINIEGGLEAADCEAYRTGEKRMVGHALADSLVVHLGRAAAGRLRMMRSVRLATHPVARRRGLATRLVREAEAWAQSEEGVELMGTLFGATPGLLRFRSSAGYTLARVGGSLGARTGAPAALMLRPASKGGEELLADLRSELGWALPIQLDLQQADAYLGLDQALRLALEAAAPAQGSPPSAAACRAAIEGALRGPRTLDSVQWAVERCLAGATAGSGLSPQEASLVRARILQRSSWEATRVAAGLPSVRATQRALKGALRKSLLR